MSDTTYVYIKKGVPRLITNHELSSKPVGWGLTELSKRSDGPFIRDLRRNLGKENSAGEPKWTYTNEEWVPTANWKRGA